MQINIKVILKWWFETQQSVWEQHKVEAIAVHQVHPCSSRQTLKKDRKVAATTAFLCQIDE